MSKPKSLDVDLGIINADNVEQVRLNYDFLIVSPMYRSVAAGSQLPSAPRSFLLSLDTNHVLTLPLFCVVKLLN